MVGLKKADYVHIVAGLLLCFCILNSADATCALPASFGSGSVNWTDSASGDLMITNTTMDGVSAATIGQLTLVCEVSSGTKYLMRSLPIAAGLGLFFEALTCIDFRRLSDNKYLYHYATAKNPLASNQHYQVVTAGTSTTLATVCNEPEPYEVGTYHVLVRTDSIQAEEVQCPLQLSGHFDYNITDGSALDCTDRLDACVPPPLNISHCALNVTAPIMHSCLHVDVIGSATYVTTYDNNNYTAAMLRFSCYVFSTNGFDISFSQSSQRCEANQTSTSVISGATARFYKIDDCHVDVTTGGTIDNSGQGSFIRHHGLWMPWIATLLFHLMTSMPL